ncbi:MAG TPA: GerMN domain-containing protein, partial [Thermoanaerobacterales bacterium]|nr:GerMN domain-containing protein [Thermoanaerobacterales bacterium]
MKRLIHATLILFIVFMLVGCGAQSPAAESGSTSDYVSSAPSGKMVSVYYIKDGFLTPVAYNVGVSELEVNAALNLLFSGITPEGFENKLDDVKLNSLVIDGDTVFIDVSGEFLQGKMIDLAKNQIIYTLTDCENIFKVNIAVDGKPYETLLERPPFINLTNPEDYEKDKENPEEMSKYLTIYYTDQDKEYLIPVTIKSDKIEPKTENSDKPSTVKAEDKARAALQHLIERTSKIESLETLDDKMIKSLRLDDGIAVVDLDKKIILIDFNIKTQYAEIAVESVVRTLTSIDGIEKVQFL